MTTPTANYEEELLAITALFEPECRQPILLLRGAAGKGKTTLLSRALEDLPPGVKCLRIDLKGSEVGVDEIFQRPSHYFNWTPLSHFTLQLERLEIPGPVRTSTNIQVGIGNRIREVLSVEDRPTRDRRYALLTEAWFRDILALPGPLVFVFDTYNHAGTETREWISRLFLPRIALCEGVRAVVAGQEVPDRNTIEWGHCCRECTLKGVPEPHHWESVIEHMGRRITAVGLEARRDYLRGICDFAEGDPYGIMHWIETLPREGSPT